MKFVIIIIIINFHLYFNTIFLQNRGVPRNTIWVTLMMLYVTGFSIVNMPDIVVSNTSKVVTKSRIKTV